MSASQFAQMRPISADSHVAEPPDCYINRIEPKFRDRAPHLVNDPVKGATFIIDTLKPLAVGLVAAAGIKPSELKQKETRSFDKIDRGAWDPKVRVEAMDLDGLQAEMIYPTVGMALYWVTDLEYMAACMDAYNRWLQEFVSAAPKRLYGIGQSPAITPERFIEDIRRIKGLGLKGVMMPATPPYAKDYDDADWDPAWEAAADLKLPLCFHVLVSQGAVQTKVRGGKLGNIMNVIRANQDVLGAFVFGGVFARHPNLRVVCVEADAGWVPHYVARMDHAYERFGQWLDTNQLTRLPSEYMQDNISFTFQDDVVALSSLDRVNPSNLLWATDYPHIDSTWPHSMELLEKSTRGIDPARVKAIIHDNVVALFGLDG